MKIRNIYQRIKLVEFYRKYETKYQVSHNLEKLLTILCDSCLITEKEPDIYCFAYKYVYYFLVAKKSINND